MNVENTITINKSLELIINESLITFPTSRELDNFLYKSVLVLQGAELQYKLRQNNYNHSILKESGFTQSFLPCCSKPLFNVRTNGPKFFKGCYSRFNEIPPACHKMTTVAFTTSSSKRFLE